jgi:hypothetical protein
MSNLLIKWRPVLELWVDIHFLQIATAVLREQIQDDVIEYVLLDVRVFRKWGFRIRLYDTWVRRMEAR